MEHIHICKTIYMQSYYLSFITALNYCIFWVLIKLYCISKCWIVNILTFSSKIVSEYDQEIPQSQTADNPMAPPGRAAQPSRGKTKTNKAKQPALSSPSR